MSYRRSSNGGTAFLVIVGILAWIALILIIQTTVLVTNINDMINQGYASFWPIFWILFTGVLLSIPTATIKAATS